MTQLAYPSSARTGTELNSKAIDSRYYNITDTESWPVAGLLVLLDQQGQPVRSELHLYEDLASHIQEGAIRQSRQILQMDYSSDAVVPLRILQTSQMRDAVDVRLEARNESVRPQRKSPVPLFAIAGTAAVVAIVILTALALRGSQGIPGADLATGGASATAPSVQEITSTGQGAEAAQQAAGVEALEPEPALPASRNARSDLGLGTRVALVPGLRLTLRSEPGADAGVPVGYMMDDDTAVIVGGPELTEGTSDTIVWWLVNLDDGTEAWAAANTSDQTLLIPAQ